MIEGRLGIAGVGLIGGSIAARARARGVSVVGYDRDPATLALAHRHGLIDDIAIDVGTLAATSDVLVLALPVDATLAALSELAARAARGALRPTLLLDVASTKVRIAAAGRDLPGFIATHPLAGSERSGPMAADAELFVGRTWAYVPTGDEREARVRAFIAACGSIPLAVDAATHDTAVALTSHVPQALAVCLGALLAERGAVEPNTYALCGPGIGSMLRLARSPVSMWEPIYRENAAPVAAVLRAYAEQVLAAAAALEGGDPQPLLAAFAAAAQAVDRIEDRRDEMQGAEPHANGAR